MDQPSFWSRLETTQLPLKRIALWGFLLNAVWEFAQCVFLYDMWQWGIWRGTIWMWGAIVGDVVIVLCIVGIASFLAGVAHVNPPDTRGWIALITTSIVASVMLEWAALYLELWTYVDTMPTVGVLGFKIGLSPIFQISLLPSLSMFFAYREEYFPQ